MEWYGGGPEFPRRIVSTRQGLQIELYPPILYGYLCGPKGHETKESGFPFVSNPRTTLGEVVCTLKRKYNTADEETRLWFKKRTSFKWTKKEDMKETIGKLEAFDCDSLMLEVKKEGNEESECREMAERRM